MNIYIENFHFNININVYTHNEPELLQKDRRSMTYYDATINFMWYNNHFMYYINLQQIRHCYKCKRVQK